MRFLVVLVLLVSASVSIAKDNNIICTAQAYSQNGVYQELRPTTFTVSIKEDQNGNAVSASTDANKNCIYTNIKKYSSTEIIFDTCKSRTGNDQFPRGYLNINRVTGDFVMSTELSSRADGQLISYGTCRAGIQKF